MLPHYKNVNTVSSPFDPIHATLYSMSFVYNDESKFNKSDLLYINDNTTHYDLHKSVIDITINMEEKRAITGLCDLFNDVKQIIISLENRKGEITRTITLDMPQNCVEDFSFAQGWNEHEKLTNFNISLKYTEITSEIIS